MDASSSIPVADQTLLLIASELAALVGSYAVVHKDELDEYGGKVATLSAKAMTEDVPALLELAIKQYKGDK